MSRDEVVFEQESLFLLCRRCITMCANEHRNKNAKCAHLEDKFIIISYILH